MTRNTTLRDRHRGLIARDEPPCGICGEDIDYSLPHTHLRSFVVDHITPLSAGRLEDLDVLDNKQPAHRDCNREKGSKVPKMPVVFETDRNWQ